MSRNLKLAEEFKKGEEPWSIKQTVLERNTVHANNLIRLYISLDIEMEARMEIWQFFQVGNGIVGTVKEIIKILKRVTNVLEKQQQYGMDLSNTTDLYLFRGEVPLSSIEAELKEYPKLMKTIKKQKKRNAALKRAKKRQAKKDDKKVTKRELLRMLKAAEKEGHTIQDVVVELERQLQ
jgi:hypothetical protein